MRTIQDIQKIIIKEKDKYPELNELNSTSKTAIWRLWVFIIAYITYTLEVIFANHKKETNEQLSLLKPHTLRWYRDKALKFQDGFTLKIDSDQYDNQNATEEQIKASQKIKYAAVVEAENQARLIVKVTGEKDQKMSQLPHEVFERFKHYMGEVKDAGVLITFVNYPADKLRLKITIIRDKLVLKPNGENILLGVNEVEKAIKDHLKHLPFNGELSLQKLTDKIQQVNGVLDLSIEQAQTSYIDETGLYSKWEDIRIRKVPVSGYFDVKMDIKYN